MVKKIGLIAAFFLATIVHGQEPPISYKSMDSITYALFLKQEWKDLLTQGKKSHKEGIDFYYLNVRMGIAYFKQGKMFLAVKMLEKAYLTDPYDTVVQDYLYWAYRYSGLVLEADVFYTKMAKELQDQIDLKLHFVSAIDLGVVASSNSDYDELLSGMDNNNTTDSRIFPENFQLYSLGLNHRFSHSTNFFHRLTLMPRNSVLQENVAGRPVNTEYQGNETRYYADVTFALGKRVYLDVYLNLIFGNFDELDDSIGNSQNGRFANSGNTLNYNNVVFGATIARVCYYLKQSLNLSYANLNESNQFQAGYSISIFPLGNTLLVPFGSVQFQNESSDFVNENRMVYTGGLELNTKDFSLTGYINTGEIRNFASNNASIIYNQNATALNEYGLIFQLHLKKVGLKLGYSYMNMEDFYFSEDLDYTSSFNFNQQNIIGGITWKI